MDVMNIQNAILLFGESRPKKNVLIADLLLLKPKPAKNAATKIVMRKILW